jgi:Calcium binding
VRPDECWVYFLGPLNQPLRLPAVTELSEAELDALVEQAIVDAYGDDEQLVGFYTMIDDNLALPFTTTVLGVEADVVRVDVTDSGIVALCARGAVRQAIPILDLRLPVPAPPGSEWIAAYRRWAGGQ